MDTATHLVTGIEAIGAAGDANQRLFSVVPVFFMVLVVPVPAVPPAFFMVHEPEP
jgi:hypothetical protein